MLGGVCLQQAVDGIDSPSTFNQALPACLPSSASSAPLEEGVLPTGFEVVPESPSELSSGSPAPSGESHLSTGFEAVPEPSPGSECEQKWKPTRRRKKGGQTTRVSAEDTRTAGSMPTPTPTQLEPEFSSGKKTTRHAHESRAKNRRKNQDPTAYEVRPGTLSRVLEEATTIAVDSEALQFAEGSSGYIGKGGCHDNRASYSLDEVLDMGLQLYRWDASFSATVVDSNERIFSALLENPPNDASWEGVQQEAADALEAARERLELSEEQKHHRRGDFWAASYGDSMGGGQKYPKRLEQTASNLPILEGLASLPSFQRLAGWASAGFATWAPRLYKKYSETMSKLREHDPSIRFNWATSIFAAATFNFGPQTVSCLHQDYLNYVFGWCAVTALGSFDYHLGGHLILWDLGLVIEFPPGATILIPSAYLKHSNTTIGPGERRYSFTQYTAGGIFRERRRKEKEAREGVSAGMELYSSLEELRARRG
ncbi:hypothetical protein VKT23_020675 [Stygiomarasmius scandens]|uniref:Uncharacterized protein n=1 Tax=Marasmiellus scandens TaxID=2682957 RepID=A0ABR1IIK1_9AGAR